jgi:hypothetical protein
VFSSGVGAPRSKPRNRSHERRSRIRWPAGDCAANAERHELHAGVREVVLRLQDQGLEHRHRVEGRAAALAPIAIAEPFHQPAPEVLEVHRRLENLQRVAVLAQPLQVLREPEKACLLHDAS